MRVEFALLAGLLSSSALAYGGYGGYGGDDGGNVDTGPKVKTITKYITKNNWRTRTVIKTHCTTITKYRVSTKVDTKTVTVTVDPKPATEDDGGYGSGDDDEEYNEDTPAEDPAEDDNSDDDKNDDDKNDDEPENTPAVKPTGTDEEEEPEPTTEPGAETPAEDEPKPAPKSHTIKATIVDGKPAFDPSSLMAATGDTVVFEFHPMSHSVVRGSFDKPCTPVEDVDQDVKGFFSGMLPVSADATDFPTFKIKVEDSDPIWFYCSAGKHCQAGMVGVINPPPDKTDKDYAKAAAGASANVSPKKVGGGI